MTSYRLRIVLEAELPLEHLNARVRFAELDNPANRPAVDLVLVDGVYEGQLEDRPRHFFLTDPTDLEAGDPTVDGESTEQRCQEAGTVQEVDVIHLFTEGVPVPDSGELRLRLTGLSCHAADWRYLGHEHKECAARIGLPADGSADPSSTWVNPITPLLCGTDGPTYGDIVAVAGDHFAFYDQEASEALRDSWPDPNGLGAKLAGDPPDYRRPYLIEADPAEVALIARRPDVVPLLLPAPRRFLALAAHNYCHFAHPLHTAGGDQESNLPLRCYRYYHERGRKVAAAGAGDVQQLYAALAIDAFGAHFLTDLFASGHLRVPRQQLSMHGGLITGSLWRAKRMHDEDNKRGLLVTTRHCFGPRWVWRTYGDKWLSFQPEHTNQGNTHKRVAQESVRRSAADIERAWLGLPPLLGGDGAEALLPVVLPVGEIPKQDDVVPFTNDKVWGHGPNHPPMFKIGQDEQGRDVLLQRLGWKPDGDTWTFRSLGPLTKQPDNA